MLPFATTTGEAIETFAILAFIAFLLWLTLGRDS